MGGALFVLAFVAWARGRPVPSACLAVPGGLLVLGGLAFPTRLGPIQRGWMAMARSISRVTSPIVLGVAYFLVLTPTGLLLRLFGKNPLLRSESVGSFWVARSPGGESPGSMERQF